jgi:hypothetical protein
MRNRTIWTPKMTNEVANAVRKVVIVIPAEACAVPADAPAITAEEEAAAAADVVDMMKMFSKLLRHREEVRGSRRSTSSPRKADDSVESAFC